jgi:hypothetical protein
MTTEEVPTAPESLPAPVGLERRGRAFWDHTTARYTLSEAERQMLAEVCRSLDTVEALEAALVAHGVTVEGSKGQPRLHPAVAEIRQQRLALGRLLAQLDLPDEHGEAIASPSQARARKAARARWDLTPRRS